MKTAQRRQQSYADKQRRELEFVVGEHLFVKISPMKGVIRFGKKRKLSLRNIGPFELNLNMSYEEMPMQILDRQERRLRNKVIHMVNVKWINHSKKEATWETESDKRSRDPQLYDES
ncbi:uncharacterized protein [Primulina huaijiensis]|uniref:uncharacterized protein n=1 Tax=Primulina huaijiensis TaxID=1492673 RepID=UPI003CC78BC6